MDEVERRCAKFLPQPSQDTTEGVKPAPAHHKILLSRQNIRAGAQSETTHFVNALDRDQETVRTWTPPATLIRTIAQQMVTQDTEFLTKRPRQRGEGLTSHRRDLVGYTVYYGVESHRTGVADYDALFGKIREFIEAGAPDIHPTDRARLLQLQSRAAIKAKSTEEDQFT